MRRCDGHDMTRAKKPQRAGQAVPIEDARGPHKTKPLSPNEDSGVVGMDSLIAQVQTMVEESGNPERFDAATWLARWMDRPLPALGGKRPAELMDTPEGRALVSNIIACMQSGSYL